MNSIIKSPLSWCQLIGEKWNMYIGFWCLRRKFNSIKFLSVFFFDYIFHVFYRTNKIWIGQFDILKANGEVWLGAISIIETPLPFCELYMYIIPGILYNREFVNNPLNKLLSSHPLTHVQPPMSLFTSARCQKHIWPYIYHLRHLIFTSRYVSHIYWHSLYFIFIISQHFFFKKTTTKITCDKKFM